MSDSNRQVDVLVAFGPQDKAFVDHLVARVSSPRLRLVTDLGDNDAIVTKVLQTDSSAFLRADVLLVVHISESENLLPPETVQLSMDRLKNGFRVVALSVPPKPKPTPKSRRFVVEDPILANAVLLRDFSGTLTASHVEQIRAALDPAHKPQLKHAISQRNVVLDGDQASRLLGGAEALLADAQHLLDDESSEVSVEELRQLEQDIQIVRAALRSPRPDTVTIERALARIALTVATTQLPAEELIGELELVGLSRVDADAVATDIDKVTQLVGDLGSVEAEPDVATAKGIQDAIGRIEDRLAALSPPSGDASDVVPDDDPRHRIRDARFRGRERFWAELWPEQKAKIVGRLVNTGLAVSGSVAVSKLGISASIIHLAKSLLQNAFS